MKKNYMRLIVALLFATNLMAQNIPNYVPTNGLVGWWPFNGNANDESGNGNHGTVNGVSLTSDRFGNASSAYNFDGLANYIKVANSSIAAFGQQSFSAIAWFKTSFTNLNHDGMFIMYDNCVSNSGWGLGINSGYKIYGMEFPANRNGCSVTSTNNYNDNQWHQAIFIRNITLMTDFLYVDGTLIGQFKFTSINNLIITNSDLRFGSCGGYQFLNGLLDDIAIYNRALTQPEITALYTGTPPCTNPTASITTQSTTTFCQGGSVNLNASTGANYTYEWYNNGNIINGATSSIYNASTSGNYTVKVIDGTCNTTSSATAVNVNANPSVSLNSLNAYTLKTSSPIQLVGNPTGGSYGGEGVTGSTFNPTTVALGKKTITYNYTSPQGCSGSASKTTIVADTVGNVCSVTKYDTITTKITVNDTVGILKISFQLTTGIKANTVTNISVYPNPTSDVLIIDATDSPALAGYTYRILDVQGKQIYNALVTSSKTEIALKTLGAKGVYVLHIVDANGISIENKKIVLQ